MADNNERVMGWDDEFEGGEGRTPFVVLEHGIYSFTVKDIKKGQYSPTAASKLPACPKAEVSMVFDGGEQGTTTITENFYLLESQSWKMSDFFACLGIERNADGKYSPRCFKDAKGKAGIAEVTVRDYTKRDGTPGQSNNVKAYLAPGSANVGVIADKPAAAKAAPATAAKDAETDEW